MEIRKLWPEIKGKVSGVYCIANSIDERVYIGSSAHLRSRMSGHWHDLRNDKHHSPSLQNFYKKYGSDKLVPKVLELCDVQSLVDREQYWIDSYTEHHKEKNLFNIAFTAGSCLGVKRDPIKAKQRGAKRKENALEKHFALVQEHRDKEAYEDALIMKRAKGKCELCLHPVNFSPSAEGEYEFHTTLNTNEDRHWKLASISTKIFVCSRCFDNYREQEAAVQRIARWLAKQK